MSVILRALGGLAVVGFAAAAVVGLRLSPDVPTEAPLASLPAPSTTALPQVGAGAGPSLLGRSPFARDRSPFARNAGPAAPEVPIEVRLAGIFKVGNETRANLIVGGQSVVVKKGDETPIGVVTDIEASAVIFGGATPPRRVEMFKQ